MTAGPQFPWSGPWADDARRIYAILQSHDGHHTGPPGGGTGDEPTSSTGEGRSPAHAGSPGGGAGGEPTSSPGREFCPLCQGMAVMRRSGPDVLDRVAELAAGLAATLRATGPPPPEDDPGGRAAGGAAGTSPPPAGPSARPPVTVPIDVSD